VPGFERVDKRAANKNENGKDKAVISGNKLSLCRQKAVQVTFVFL